MSSAPPSQDVFERFCIECDYSLEGHAPGAVCPECGTKEDPSIIVLYGWFGETSAATPFGAVVNGTLMIIGVFIIITFVHRLEILALLLSLLVLFMVCEPFVRRALLEKPAPTRKLLLTPAGFRQQPLRSTVTVKGRLRRWAEIVLFVLAWIALAFVAIRFTSKSGILFGAISGVMGIYFRAMRQSHLLEKVGGSQVLVPWTRVDKVQIAATGFLRKTSELRLRIRMATRISRRETIVDFRWAPTAEQADRVITLIKQWGVWRDTDFNLTRFHPKRCES